MTKQQYHKENSNLQFCDNFFQFLSKNKIMKKKTLHGAKHSFLWFKYSSIISNNQSISSLHIPLMLILSFLIILLFLICFSMTTFWANIHISFLKPKRYPFIPLKFPPIVKITNLLSKFYHFIKIFPQFFPTPLYLILPSHYHQSYPSSSLTIVISPPPIFHTLFQAQSPPFPHQSYKVSLITLRL